MVCAKLHLKLGSVDLSRLLERAAPGPQGIWDAEGGAMLALAAHCVMVNEGFCSFDGGHPSSFSPPKDWNAWPQDVQADGYSQQWVFEYTKASSAFVMYCSLHVTGKMYVHAFETGNPDNVQVMGLNVLQYLPKKLQHPPELWDDAMINQNLFYDMCLEYICSPLLGLANLAAPQVSDDIDESFATCGYDSMDEACFEDRDSYGAFRHKSSPLLRSLSLKRQSSDLEHMLVSAPPGIMIPAILATTVAASTAVLWAWRR